jgi:hypothetical protein
MNSLMSNTNRKEALRFPSGGLAQSRQFRVWNFGRVGRKEQGMARKYSKSASKDVERAMEKRKKGTLRSGKGGKGGKVKSRKQAIAIGLSEARKEGKKVPKKKSAGRKKS